MSIARPDVNYVILRNYVNNKYFLIPYITQGRLFL